MLHEFLTFLSNNPIMCLICFLAFLWACERVVTAHINRHKPTCEHDCCDDEEDEEEVVAMGGEEEDHEPR